MSDAGQAQGRRGLASLPRLAAIRSGPPAAKRERELDGTSVAPPAVQRLGRAVLLQGPAILDAKYLIALGVRETCRRDGIAPPLRVRNLLAALDAAAEELEATSGNGHADVRRTPEMGEWFSTLESISTRDVAKMTGLSERQVRRRATDFGGRRRPGGAWVFHRGAVEASVSASEEAA